MEHWEALFALCCTFLLTEHYFGENIKEVSMGGTCRMYGEKKNVYRVLVVGK
jgi:hypothetical protein